MNTTIPEAPETIEAQLQWLREGKRKAVLLTPGCVLPELPLGISLLSMKEGVLVYRLDNETVHQVLRWQRGEIGLGTLLGYGVPAKPGKTELQNQQNSVHSEILSKAPAVVVVRGQNGHEKQAVATVSERLDKVIAAAYQTADPNDTVSVEDGAQVIGDRLRSLDQRELRVRPFDPQRDARALEMAAREDAHRPLNPTHVIERGDEIVGYFGVNSLPLYRLWFHSEKMKAADSLRLLFMIENHYRMAGVPVIATVIHTESPFYAVAARGGYLECAGDRLFLKGL